MLEEGIALVRFLDYFWVKWIFIPFLLFVLWIVLSLLYNPYESFSVLVYGHNKSELQSIPKTVLLKNEKITGTFIAPEDNLGILAIKLKDTLVHHTEQEDYLYFRIKEKEAKQWYYQHLSKVGLVRERYFFTFGFPQIKNSKDRLYQFEIVSTNGNSNNGVQVLHQNPIFFTKYKVDKKNITDNPASFSMFLMKKMGRFFSNIDSVFITSIYILPFFFYMSWIVFLKKYVLNKKLFIYLTVFFIFTTIFSIGIFLPSIFFALIDLWIIAVIRNRLSGESSIKLGMLCFFLGLVAIHLGLTTIVHRASTWAYVFICVGIFLYLWDMGCNKVYYRIRKSVMRVLNQKR